ncbi:unnamed protein product [Euphydryas editha]|uniref:Uncharacterized protein n=1 Tax=Euphydryas editha TaxID=104508 RepID=A0AAU9UT58_EUPED|nr:unnamed protein product [Euphydryas editha]
MHSHASEVKDGWGVVNYDLTPSECKQIHRDQTATILGHRITRLKKNSSMTTTVTLSISVKYDETCQGGELNLGISHWSGVLGIGKITIKMTDNTGIYRVADNRVVSKSGLSCKFTDGDAYDRLIIWDVKTEDRCSRTSYLDFYRGAATNVTVKSNSDGRDEYTMYSIKDGKF